jgi:hypothetical protein
MTTKKITYKKQWKKSFFSVDEWGRSSFRALLIGLCLILVCWGVLALTEPSSELKVSIRKYICEFGGLGIIFVFWAILGPSLEVLISAIKNKR